MYSVSKTVDLQGAVFRSSLRALELGAQIIFPDTKILLFPESFHFLQSTFFICLLLGFAFGFPTAMHQEGTCPDPCTPVFSLLPHTLMSCKTSAA